MQLREDIADNCQQVGTSAIPLHPDACPNLPCSVDQLISLLWRCKSHGSCKGGSESIGASKENTHLACGTCTCSLPRSETEHGEYLEGAATLCSKS